jgi:hypothetical protein
MSGFQCSESLTSALFWSLETIESFSLSFINIKNRKQLGDYQEISNLVCEVKKFELATAAADRGEVGDQFTNAARVHILHAAEIQQDLVLATVNQLAHSVAHRYATVSDSHCSGEVKDCHITRLSFFHIELSHDFSPSDVGNFQFVENAAARFFAI